MGKNRIPRFLFNIFRKNEIALHPLNYLFWECTQRCNLHCLHCGSDCIESSEYPDMPFDDFLKAILPLKTQYKANTITVVITGGEPLLRKDLASCGAELRRQGFNWSIVTNGFAYTEERHNQLINSGLTALTLSLDGLKENHNWLRDNNRSFEKASQALDLITNSPLVYDVVTCVNRNNINELAQIRQFLIDKKVRSWRLFTIAPIGRATENDRMLLRSDEIERLMEFIKASRQLDDIAVTFSCEAYTGKYERDVRDSFFFCRAGINIASVLIDGSISACPNINRNFAQGNIYQDDFLDVWNNRFEIMRNRSWSKVGKCANCKDFKRCNGGAMHLWDEKREDILCCLQN